ncbi:putative lysosomal alpha-glucosidase-like [Penaeus vannamei]|uniref:Putative lysosomal alpha-glucosidase-like n=1 Tax=Penaeus vannamei TaxID=6689 RepID=A0A423SQ98_PENVA|nr:putative lysosomal alpha-glucosidase-like [Penaeus vannamei]
MLFFSPHQLSHSELRTSFFDTNEVISQYTEVIGRPFLPPYWSLGYHQCRYGYETLNRTRDVWQRTRKAGIPFDVQWNDIDYMKHNNDFTYDQTNYDGLPDFVEDLHREGMHYVPIIDPGISAAEPQHTYPAQATSQRAT